MKPKLLLFTLLLTFCQSVRWNKFGSCASGKTVLEEFWEWCLWISASLRRATFKANVGVPFQAKHLKNSDTSQEFWKGCAIFQRYVCMCTHTLHSPAYEWEAVNSCHKMDGQFVAPDHSLENRLLHCSVLSLAVPNPRGCLRHNYHVRHKSSPWEQG